MQNQKKSISIFEVSKINIPILLPPILIVLFSIGLFILFVPVLRIILPNFEFSSCSSQNWGGYNVCEHDAWNLSIYISLFFSTILSWILTSLILKFSSIKTISPLWGVTASYVPILLVILVYQVILFFKSDGMNVYIDLLMIVFVLLTIVTFVSAITINSVLYYRKQ
jgi:hypothetical protein